MILLLSITELIIKLMNQKGLAPILILLGILIILSVGVSGYFVVNNNDFKNNQNKSTNIQPTSKHQVTTSPTIQATTDNYCSMANGCPIDKCKVVTRCASGGAGTGCVPGPTTCEYKDLYLKGDYKEISFANARHCVNDFVNKNSNAYPTLKNLVIDEGNSSKESSNCSPLLENDSKFNKDDRFCYFMAMQHKTDKNFPFAPHFYVGAQTCNVYWDLPEAFKIDISTLTTVNYSPHQAIKCAEKYIDSNKAKYLEYKNFEAGSLSVPNKEAGPHAKVTDLSKDVSFYTVIGNSNPKSLYLVVGAHSCTTYGVNEEYYTKL